VVAATLKADDPLILLGVVELTFATGLHDRYQLLLSDALGTEATAVCALPDGRTLVDGMVEPSALRVLGGLPELGPDAPATSGTVRFRRADGADHVAEPAQARPLGADTTNSAAVLDEQILLKAYRRIGPGTNPEIEVLAHLARVGFDGVPEILGWWEHVDETSEATLGLLQRFVPMAVDGWTLAVADAASTATSGCSIESHLGALGGLTAALHGALASGPADGSFVPEWPHADQLGLLSASLDERLTELSGSELMDDKQPVLAELRLRLAAAARTPDIGCLIRGHGDYHLGQALSASGKWWIVDFEGEPMRETSERRRRSSPLRDVAGMLRSIDYAASVGGLGGEPTQTNAWRREARRAFLDAYLASSESERLLPRQWQSTRDLLFVLELEKVLYEIEYEQAHRPEWVDIPVNGLRDLVEQDSAA
jgi:maltokinase